VNPAFPVYIVSKGRWESRLTSKTFEAMGVPYSIVVEEQEYKAYCEVIDKAKVLVLDKAYQRDYDAFSDLGIKESKGSGPARNFVWDHAVACGAAWHWTVDDNIKAFYRWNRNLKVPVSDGTIFKCMEDFVERYDNVAMAGPNYFMFASRKSKAPPLQLNTRIYSCNLIRTASPFRWRGRYNEDTDLSLRMLKAGWCTVLFNAFLQEKTTTLTMKGGNTDTIYKDGTLPKCQMLVDMHPDVCQLAWRFGRPHHFCDYKRFQHGLIKKAGIEVPAEVDNYGMELVQIKPPSSPSCGDRT
jgi:uncharacterized protein involved in tolerance to divalent cations